MLLDRERIDDETPAGQSAADRIPGHTALILQRSAPYRSHHLRQQPVGPPTPSWTSGPTTRWRFSLCSLPMRWLCVTSTSARPSSRSKRGPLHDRFYVRNRFGQKLLDPGDQEQLRPDCRCSSNNHARADVGAQIRESAGTFDQFSILCSKVRARGKTGLGLHQRQKTFPLLSAGCSAPAIFMGRLSSGGNTSTCCRCSGTIATRRSSNHATLRRS